MASARGRGPEPGRARGPSRLDLVAAAHASPPLRRPVTRRGHRARRLQTEAQVRGLLEATPSMPATVLAEWVGLAGSATWFRQNVALMGVRWAERVYDTGCGVWLLTVEPGCVDGRSE
jgi:hypothetical protein